VDAAHTVMSGHVWIDAQLPPVPARWLASSFGIDAIHIEGVGLLHADGRAIFQAARAANVVMMTKDEDFVKLLDRFGPPPQVAWVTCGNIGNAELRQIILSTWPAVATLLARGEPLVEIDRPE
jgi:predicted nuclease of predicted toxin-antitoxin system